jgi:hypothetical protein
MTTIDGIDIYVEVVHPSGYYNLSTMTNTRRIHKMYGGYDLEEALADFVEVVKNV